MKMQWTTRLVVPLACAALLGACSTTAEFRLPPQTQIRLGSHEEAHDAGKISTRPYFWTASAGIPYQIVRDGKQVGEGRIESSFRPVSIFWPPYALIYWPLGFGWACYDITAAEPASCKAAAE